MLSDPFQTTYEGARQGLGTLGESISGVAGLYAKKRQEEQKQQQTMDMLRQIGIVKEKPLSVDDYKKSAEEQLGKRGGIDISSTLPEEEQIKIAQQLFAATGLKPPESKGFKVDFDEAAKAGMEFNPTTGEVIFKPQRQKIGALSYEDISDLPTDTQVQVDALARKIYGVRGLAQGREVVAQEVRKGKSVDQIEDELRFSGQSKEFAGPVRNAVQNILLGETKEKSQKAMDDIDDYLGQGDVEGAKNAMKRLARRQAGVEEEKSINGREATIKLIDNIQGDLNALEKMGISTNIFTGTKEQIANKIGTTANPEAKRIATKIMVALQNYRYSVSGKAFSVPESKEYKEIFPSIGRTANFNSSNIRGLKEALKTDLDSFYALAMGEGNYEKLFGGEAGDILIPQKQAISEIQPDKHGFRVGETKYSKKLGKTLTYRGGGEWE